MTVSTNDFIIMWCSTGLEYIEDITGKRQQYTMSILAGNDPPKVANMEGMMIRARMNPQRNYEIYGLKCDTSITKDVIEEMFDNSPQEIVDLIRSHGVKFYSDRSSTKQVIT